MRNLSLKLMLFTGSFRMNIKSKTVCTGINFHKCCLFVGVLGSDCSDFLFPPYILKHTVGVSGSLRFSGWPQASFQSMKAFWRRFLIYGYPRLIVMVQDVLQDKIVTKSEPKTPPNKQDLWKLMPVHTVLLKTFILKDPVYLDFVKSIEQKL